MTGDLNLLPNLSFKQICGKLSTLELSLLHIVTLHHLPSFLNRPHPPISFLHIVTSHKHVSQYVWQPRTRQCVMTAKPKCQAEGRLSPRQAPTSPVQKFQHLAWSGLSSTASFWLLRTRECKRQEDLSQTLHCT